MDARLEAIVRPPGTMGHVFSRDDWTTLERTLGTSLPGDVVEMHERFGSGWFGDHVIMPLLPAERGVLSLIPSHTEAASILQVLIDDGVLAGANAAYPVQGGLLEWADSGNGHMWFWRTDGESKDWTVVAVPEGYDQPIYRYDMGATGYLGALLSGDIDDDFAAGLLALEDPPVSTFIAAIGQ